MPPTSKSINAHLQSLLPHYTTSTLPPALVELTASLSATSRARAPRLRGDEEVAREYICGYMAIERLKVRLNLPEAQLKPPVPPRTFDRLLRSFEQLMPVSSAGVVAAAVLRRGAEHGVSSSSSSAKKRRRLSADADADAASPREQATADRGSSVDGWLAEYLADLGRAIGAPGGFAAAVARGVRAVFPEYGAVALPEAQAAVSKRELGLRERLSKTVVAVALVALPRLGREVTAVRETTRVAVKELIVRRMVPMTQFGRMLAEAEALLADRQGVWAAMDWCAELRPVTPAPVDDVVPPSIAEHAHPVSDSSNTPAATAAPTATLLTGTSAAPYVEQEVVDDEMDDLEDAPLRDLPRTVAGSMLNSREDWLSPERRQDYARWKAETLRKIETLEAQQGAAAAA